MPKKDTINFLKIICLNSSKKPDKYNLLYNVKEISSFLESISESSRKSIFSDPYWNRYPKYVYWNQISIDNERCHGRGLNELAEYININKNKYPKTYNSLLLNSVGIFLNLTINNFSGKDKIRLAKRGLNSKDPRVRKISARILPVKMIENLANDSDWGIRSIVANRISPSAKPNLFLNSRNTKARLEALAAIKLEKDTIFQMINEKMPYANEYQTSKEIICLLNKLNDSDLLFFVNICQKTKIITDYFNNRIS